MKRFVLIFSIIVSVAAGQTVRNGAIQFPEITPPGNPPANSLNVYVKDDASTSKLCSKDSSGTESCGLGAGGSAETFSGTLDLVIDWYAANNSANMDHKITNGPYIALIHHDTNGTDGFNSPTNAVHTVTTGKVAVVVKVYATGIVIADPSFRGMRLQNTTDTIPVIDVGSNYNNSASGGVPRVAADSAELPSVAAGKAIELQTWNNGATSRGRGGFVVLKEVDAP